MTDILEFTGLDMLKIDLANTYGLDKLTFEDRIEWANAAMHSSIKSFEAKASEPLLFKKAALAIKQALTGAPIGHNVFMDATTSGIQIMACLSNCESSGLLTNLVDPTDRYDAYMAVAEVMMKELPNSKMFDGLDASGIRKIVKKPIMTTMYNSVENPKSIFGSETDELYCFYETLEKLFPGPMAVMDIINECWNSNALAHTWTLPDGHVAHVPVTEMKSISIKPDELSTSFSYRFEQVTSSTNYRSLAPNIIHSIDAYIVREVVRRCSFEVAAIHDAYTSHPNDMPIVMDSYRNILADIAESNLLEEILTEVTGSPVPLQKFDYDLASKCRKARYALS